MTHQIASPSMYGRICAGICTKSEFILCERHLSSNKPYPAPLRAQPDFTVNAETEGRVYIST